jgi:hypothetical protein
MMYVSRGLQERVIRDHTIGLLDWAGAGPSH